MADAGSYTKLQRLGSEAPQNYANASKFYYHFLYKAIAVTIFLVLLPLLSSQAPEFVNQNLHTRSWELVQLIFVGIAVSYGLFSKRSEETEKDHGSKFDNAQSYISRLLHVSSVFDDEAENPSEFDENKIQTWNSQYHRSEPVVGVAKRSPVHQEQKTASSLMAEKPLLLPVRSLKSRVYETDVLETSEISKESSANIRSLSRSSSTSGSTRFSSNANGSRNGGLRGVSNQNLEEGLEGNTLNRSGSRRFSGNGEFAGISPETMEEVEDNVVHRSPIPWQSRSGMTEMEDEDGQFQSYISPSMENSELYRLRSRSFRSLSSQSSRVDSNSPSPKKLSPSPSLSSPSKLSPSPSFSVESQAKSSEDFVRKKSFAKASPPPAPPPPPPPPFLRKPPLMKTNSSTRNEEITPSKELRRSARSVPMEFSESERVEVPRRANSGSELRGGNQIDRPFMGKSVRTIRPSEALNQRTMVKGYGEDFIDGRKEKWSKEIEESFVDKREYTNKLIHEKVPNTPRQTFMEFPEEENEEYIEKVLVETEDDTETESEDDYFEETTGVEELGLGKEEVGSGKEESAIDTASDGGPDVDKKADEFIAKFREQIRLQRIESIRRSTAQQARRSSR